MRFPITAFLVCFLLAASSVSNAADLHAPTQVTAGTGFAISGAGSGQGTFYLIGPASAIKRQVDFGTDIQIQSEEVEQAGRYTAIACSAISVRQRIFMFIRQLRAG